MGSCSMTGIILSPIMMIKDQYEVYAPLVSDQKPLERSSDQPKTDESVSTFVSALKVCGNMKSLPEGKRIHAVIVAPAEQGKNPQLGRFLIDMYGKCGALEDAKAVFNNMHPEDVFAADAMIKAYTGSCHFNQAFQLLQQMNIEVKEGENVMFLNIMKSCKSSSKLAELKLIHSFIIDRLKLDITLATSLVNMYGKCGSLEDAQRVFNLMPKQNFVTWNTIICMYVQHERAKIAFHLFLKMLYEGIIPNKLTFMTILKTASNLGEGKLLHACILVSRSDPDVVVMTAILSMYGNCGGVSNAWDMFRTMSRQTVVTWNAMIATYVKYAHLVEAFQLFEEMKFQRMQPTETTFITLLNAYEGSAALAGGKMLHACIVNDQFHIDGTIGIALVNMYGKCSDLYTAHELFDAISKENVVLWNILMTAYVQLEDNRKALHLFHLMQQEGVQPDKVTFISILKACSSPAIPSVGKVIHACILCKGMEHDIMMEGSLVNMYGKCRNLCDACRVFEVMHVPNIVAWNSMLAAYAQHEFHKEVLSLFGQMQQVRIVPDQTTLSTILDAFAIPTAPTEGRLLHSYIIGKGFHLDVVVGTALINMYGKCGCLDEARVIFNSICTNDVILWAAMFTAYAEHGRGRETLLLFYDMQLRGLKANSVIFISVLSACSHACLFNEGLNYFVTMSRGYYLTLETKHQGCIIDLLGRDGLLDEAEDFVHNIPIQFCTIAWTALLGACRNCWDLKRGHRIAMHVCDLDPDNVGAYVLLSNIYASFDYDNAEHDQEISCA